MALNQKALHFPLSNNTRSQSWSRWKLKGNLFLTLTRVKSSKMFANRRQFTHTSHVSKLLKGRHILEIWYHKTEFLRTYKDLIVQDRHVVTAEHHEALSGLLDAGHTHFIHLWSSCHELTADTSYTDDTHSLVLFLSKPPF